MRIELTTTAWEAVVLPLNYTRISNRLSMFLAVISGAGNENTPHCNKQKQ